MNSGAKIPTELDIQCRANLHHIMNPEHHHLINDWMRTASEPEKRGVVKLARIAEAPLYQSIGRPAPGGFQPSTAVNPWYHRKQPPGSTGGSLKKSGSAPFLGTLQPASEWVPPSWMHEDAAIVGEIPKPGGYVIQLKDSIEIQRLKNTQRNSGTYNLFQGGFDGQSTQQTAHSLSAIGQA